MEALRPLGYQALPTAKQGDCGIEAMTFWSGRERTEATWKALRIELSSSPEAWDLAWHIICKALGEGPAHGASGRGPRADGQEPPERFRTYPKRCLQQNQEARDALVCRQQCDICVCSLAPDRNVELACWCLRSRRPFPLICPRMGMHLR